MCSCAGTGGGWQGRWRSARTRTRDCVAVDSHPAVTEQLHTCASSVPAREVLPGERVTQITGI